jgi:hypothetical protein
MSARETMSIWFFCGIMLLAYGVIISASGVYELSHPPLNPPTLQNLHAGIWWGAILAVAGLFYTVKFFPKKHSRI